MKTTLLALLFFLPFCSLSAQTSTYHPLLKEGRTWDVYYGSIPDCSIVPLYCNGYRVFLQGDTILEGEVFRKLYAAQMYPLEASVFVPPFGLSEDEYLLGLLGLLAEDTTAQKVYRWLPERGEAVLIYDFSLQLGDTLYTPFQLSGNDSILVVDSIGTVSLIQGQTRRIFFFDGDLEAAKGTQDYYVEGVGGAYALLEPIVAIFENASKIGCVQDEGVAFFGQCQEVVVSTTDIPAPSTRWNVFPNPASSGQRVHLQFSGIIPTGTGEAQLKVYNGVGQLLEAHQWSILSGSHSLLLEQPEGSYYLKLTVGGTEYEVLPLILF